MSNNTSMNNLFTPLDIIWTKNVTSSTNEHAYMDLESEDFVLHFPTVHRKNALRPSVGELILIHQKINSTRCFTHLVTPIDNSIVDTKSESNFRFGRRVKTVAISPLNSLIPVSSTIWANVSFQGISQGNACRIDKISGIENTDEYLKNIWDQLTPFFVDRFKQSVVNTNSYLNEIESQDQDLSVREGKMKLVSHYRRERNSEIVNRKKEIAIANDNLKCEVCNFSFAKKFGVNFIECHHLNPISQTGKTETTLNDLALVCANCHRMLHKKIDGEFLSIKQLRSRINGFAH